MIVVDSNILFSALLSKNSLIFETLLNEDYSFISPNFIFTEIFKYKEKIVKHSKLSNDELLELLNNLLSRIQFISMSFISSESINKAISLCKDIDEKDTMFVALTIEMTAELWTGDKHLKDGLMAKGFNQFFIIDSTK